MTDAEGMDSRPLLGFRLETIQVPIPHVLPLKKIQPATKNSQKYQQIVASIKAVGIVEPLVVSPAKNRKSKYYLLDGLLRLEALKDMGKQEVECLVSTDDESYTYNKRVNRLSSVQEHKMVVRAIDRGVSAAKLANALNLEVTSIQRRFRLLDGICKEVEVLLSDKPCPMLTLEILKKMKPLRQIEAGELMIGQQNYTSNFARALLHATPPEQLVAPKATGRKKDAARDQVAKLERELASLQAKTMFEEETFGVDNLVLTVAKGFVARLVESPLVSGWLKRNHPEYLAEFNKLASADAYPSIAP